VTIDHDQPVRALRLGDGCEGTEHNWAVSTDEQRQSVATMRRPHHLARGYDEAAKGFLVQEPGRPTLTPWSLELHVASVAYAEVAEALR
jgi:hypothetical protein